MAAQSVRAVVKKKPRLPPLPTVRDLLHLYGLRALRNLSQNFLLEPKLINKLVRVAGVIEDGEVCEVGPGPGGITRALLERNPRKVVVIEKDDRFQPMLEMLADASNKKLRIISGDIMTSNLSELFSPDLKRAWEDERPNIHLVGNLPFSISTPLIVRWLRDISQRSNAWVYGRVPMTLTFQLEVAERMCAPVNTNQRCRLSVMCQNWCKVKTSFKISGRAFLPPPDVDVGVVKLTPLREPTIKLPFDVIEKVVRQTFTYRQKYAYKGFSTLFPRRRRYQRSRRAFESADIDPEIRPYRITVEEFGRLCEAYSKVCESNPDLFTYNFRGRRRLEDVGLEEEEDGLEEEEDGLEEEEDGLEEEEDGLEEEEDGLEEEGENSEVVGEGAAQIHEEKKS